MAKNKEYIQFLRTTLTQAGYSVKGTEDFEGPFYSEMVVGRNGDAVSFFEPTQNPVDNAVAILERGEPLYIKGADGSLSRVCRDIASGQLEKTDAKKVPAEPVRPEEPGILSHIADFFCKIVKTRNSTCLRWENYLAKTEERSQIIAESKRIIQTTIVHVPRKEESKPDEMSIPMDIVLSGNSTELKNFIESNKLSDSQKTALQSRIAVAEKIEEMSKTPVEPHCPPPEISENKIVLPSVTQPKTQNAENGCWSVSLQSMLAYHGVNLTQEEIRDFRPDSSYKPVDELGKPMDTQKHEREEFCYRASGGVMNEIADYSDLIHKTVKDVAFHHVFLYKCNSPEYIKQIITFALKEHNSPVSMLWGSHYRTVVGIEGDNLLLLNPVTPYATNEKGQNTPTVVPIANYANGGGVVLDWLEKVSPEKIPDIQKEIQKGKANLVFTRREGVTVTDHVMLNDKIISTHDIVYPKAYDLSQQVLKSTDAEKTVINKEPAIQNKADTIIDINAIDDEMLSHYNINEIDDETLIRNGVVINENQSGNINDIVKPQAPQQPKTLTIEERNRLNKELNIEITGAGIGVKAVSHPLQPKEKDAIIGTSNYKKAKEEKSNGGRQI